MIYAYIVKRYLIRNLEEHAIIMAVGSLLVLALLMYSADLIFRKISKRRTKLNDANYEKKSD